MQAVPEDLQTPKTLAQTYSDRLRTVEEVPLLRVRQVFHHETPSGQAYELEKLPSRRVSFRGLFIVSVTYESVICTLDINDWFSATLMNETTPPR